MTPSFEVTEMWEANRFEIAAALSAPGSKARNERGALSIQKFKQIGLQVWPTQKNASSARTIKCRRCFRSMIIY